jgi:hypothetical protein
MADTKKELTIEDLQKQIEELKAQHQKDMQRVVNIANQYISLHRDYLTQTKAQLETALKLEALVYKETQE